MTAKIKLDVPQCYAPPYPTDAEWLHELSSRIRSARRTALLNGGDVVIELCDSSLEVRIQAIAARVEKLERAGEMVR